MDQTKGDQGSVLSYRGDGSRIFTKPLQDILFRKFRNVILSIVEDDIGLYKKNYKQTLIAFGLIES